MAAIKQRQLPCLLPPTAHGSSYNPQTTRLLSWDPSQPAPGQQSRLAASYRRISFPKTVYQDSLLATPFLVALSPLSFLLNNLVFVFIPQPHPLDCPSHLGKLGADDQTTLCWFLSSQTDKRCFGCNKIIPCCVTFLLWANPATIKTA